MPFRCIRETARIMRSFAALSDHDFELLVADLLREECGVRFELFGRGRDLGIDLRHLPAPGSQPDIVQCKHYLRSSYRVLLRAAKDEAQKVAALDPAPRAYRFVTTQSLTVARKRELLEALMPFAASEDNILGGEDVNALLDAHPKVERQHVKLWLTGGAQLDALLRAGLLVSPQSPQIVQRSPCPPRILAAADDHNSCTGQAKDDDAREYDMQSTS